MTIRTLTDKIAALLVEAAQQETEAKHGKYVHLSVTAWHVKLGKRRYIVSMQEYDDKHED